MDWNDLRYFLAVVRAGSLAGAARELKVEHTTVSRRLKELESALGSKLFTRAPDGLTLTAEARELMPLAESAERAMQAIERQASGRDVRAEGLVRLTTSEALSGFLIRRLGELRARHPALTVEVLSTNATLDLQRGEAELAIRASHPGAGDLIARKLFAANWAMYAAPAYLERRGSPSPVGSLRGHDVIGFDETLSRTPGAEWLTPHLDGANVVMRANSMVAALNAAIVGMGLAILPCLLGGAESHLQRVSAEALGTRDVWLVVHPDLAKVARVRAVIDFVVEVTERERALLTGEGAA
jgi:DNA-binding transcriptional LysR family regulator